MNNLAEKCMKPNMKPYYDMRHKVRELYARGPQINPKVNDLCSEILQLRDKDKAIESIDIDTIGFTIEIELEEGSDNSKSIDVSDKISKIIDHYIDDNITSINGIDRKEIESVQGQKLYDSFTVGNFIRFTL
ncbi:MAG: hypothetical protein IKR19_08115 [Acholeplasmatales bacterium]|nr:hypothetical protein [Acholeplasmatales bacterium]